MNRKKSAILVIFVFLLLLLAGYYEESKDITHHVEIQNNDESQYANVTSFNMFTKFDLETIEQMQSHRKQDAIPLVVSKEDPFYAVIATPVSLYYDDITQHIQPLLIQDGEEISNGITRFKELYPVSYKIIKPDSPKDVSIDLSKSWNTCDAVLIIEDSQGGYDMGIVAAPLACYLNIPIFVTNNVTNIKPYLEKLGVNYSFICGNLNAYGKTHKFENIEEINDLLIDFINRRFGGVSYVTVSNPLDVTTVNVLNKTYYEFEDTTSSTVILPAQTINSLIKGKSKSHTFTIPNYKYARIKIDLINKNSEHVSELGDEIMLLLKNPDGATCMYTTTQAGLPEIQDEDIITDRVHAEIIIYNKPGEYTANIIGKWFSINQGGYKLNIAIEEIDTPLQPLMYGLSSLSPYQTAYYKGIIFAKPEFAFAGNETISIEGSVYPGSNEHLISHCNEHVLKIHNELKVLLAKIADIKPDKTKLLQEYYNKDPIYIAVLGDTTMVPMFYYSSTHSHGNMAIKGFGLPNDFIYGNIDPNFYDLENDEFTDCPFMENMVGRIVAWDAEDCSALIARTLFYNKIIDKLGSWKNSATIQTCASIESRYVSILTPILNSMLDLPTEEATKWPTGETLFVNLKLTENLENGGYDVKNTFLTASQRTGFKDLAEYTKRSQILFPHFMEAISGENIVEGGENQENSNFIYALGHGMYYLCEMGDLMVDSKGFPPISWFSRFFASKGMRSGFSMHGAYTVRHVENMDFGPSTMFLQSCITGRIDGLLPENCLTQAYLHAGMNAIVAPTRHQGIVFPGITPNEFTKNLITYIAKNEYPDLHFGSLIAEDYMQSLNENTTVGMAFKTAKNNYLQKDSQFNFRIGSKLTAKKEPNMDLKNACHRVWILYGDPAFNPYQPIHNT